jgi:hypothetical protein
VLHLDVAAAKDVDRRDGLELLKARRQDAQGGLLSTSWSTWTQLLSFLCGNEASKSNTHRCGHLRSLLTRHTERLRHGGRAVLGGR